MMKTEKKSWEERILKAVDTTSLAIAIVALIIVIPAFFLAQRPKTSVFTDTTPLTQRPVVTQTIPQPFDHRNLSAAATLDKAVRNLIFIQTTVALLTLCSLSLWIWAIVTVATREPPGHDKIVWALITILTGPIGAVIYLTSRYPQLKKL
jgi:hypothetical protein